MSRIRRVPVNRVVDVAPKARREGDTMIIPVVEEELVITKRLVLKEEIHLITHRTKDRSVQEVELNRESAEIRRLDAEGRTVDAAPRTAPIRRRIHWVAGDRNFLHGVQVVPRPQMGEPTPPETRCGGRWTWRWR